MRDIRHFQETDIVELRQLVIQSQIFQKEKLESDVVNVDNIKDHVSAQFDTTLTHADQHYLVAEDEGKIVGYILVEASSIYIGQGSIDDIFILPAFRLKGLATQLVQEGLLWLKNNNVKQVGLAVHTSNSSAIKLYSECGFTPRQDKYVTLVKKLD